VQGLHGRLQAERQPGGLPHGLSGMLLLLLLLLVVMFVVVAGYVNVYVEYHQVHAKH
jgi:hypothetical protein